jgi:hypothetical protein
MKRKNLRHLAMGLTPLSMAVFLSACGGGGTPATTNTATNTPISAPAPVTVAQDTATQKGEISSRSLAPVMYSAPVKATEVKTVQDVQGFYVGKSGDAKMNLTITKVGADKAVEGYSIVSGNTRPFKGTFTENTAKKTYRFEVKEDGTDKNDGYFVFEIDIAKPDTSGNMAVRGDWTPNDKKQKGRSYRLVKKQFKYDPSIGDFPEASQRLLTEKDMQNRYAQELRVMRNEIYARHGYAFKLKDMRNFFEDKDWYLPIYSDVRADLTDIEKQNEALIKRFEKYNEKYYDQFGR